MLNRTVTDRLCCVTAVLGTSAAVQAAVAASPAMTTAVAAAVSSSAVAGGESVTSSADGGMEFTLDASTLEQLRGAGDASALMESSAAAATGFGETTSDDQPTMQVSGILLHGFILILFLFHFTWNNLKFQFLSFSLILVLADSKA